MSHKNNPSLPNRKKIPKYPPVSLRNSLNKLKKVTSGSSYVENGEDINCESKKWQNFEASNSQNDDKKIKKLSTNSCNMKMEISNEAIIEREISRSNFNVKNQSAMNVNVTKLPKNATCNLRNFSINKKLEKESDLVGMLGKQLYLAESQMHRMQEIISKTDERLKEKDKENSRLKRKVIEWQARFEKQEMVNKKELQMERKRVKNSEYLHKRCLMLEHKIYEMEKFLADYGLVWLGEAGKDTDRDLSKRNSSCDYLENCYQRLIANIEELNMTVGKGEVHVHRDKGGCGASFKTPSCVNLKFYKNGLVVQNGDIRPYENPLAASFIRDILDGYFPSELQQTYPQGVPFKVEDHRLETFQGPAGGFPGQGYRLGKIFPRENNGIGSPRRNSSSLKRTVSPTNKSNNFSDTPSPSSADMVQLRSQILASHNNNCSDSHIQSHLNAELRLSPRMAKKRELATKEAEYHISLKERTLNLRSDTRTGSKRSCSGSRTSYHSSTDRSTDRTSPSRVESTRSEHIKSRSRSSSLPGRKSRLERSLSKNQNTFDNSYVAGVSKQNDYNLARPVTVAKKPRATKSATLERKNATAPFLYKINESTGRPGELKLKVRSLNGSVVYLVHLCSDDTVGQLYELLNNYMMKSRLVGYKIVVSGYAPKRLEHFDLSLREYGILCDSVLHIVNDSA